MKNLILALTLIAATATAVAPAMAQNFVNEYCHSCQ